MKNLYKTIIRILLVLSCSQTQTLDSTIGTELATTTHKTHTINRHLTKRAEIYQVRETLNTLLDFRIILQRIIRDERASNTGNPERLAAYLQSEQNTIERIDAVRVTLNNLIHHQE